MKELGVSEFVTLEMVNHNKVTFACTKNLDVILLWGKHAFEIKHATRIHPSYCYYYHNVTGHGKQNIKLP